MGMYSVYNAVMSSKKPSMNSDVIQFTGSPESAVPKYCTNVSITSLTNGQFIMTFTYKEEPGVHYHIIERILIDGSHAENLVKELGKLVKEENE